jgi:hypothetical protein
MFPDKLLSVGGLVGAMAVSLWPWVAFSASLTPGQAEATYVPLQSISYQFGSKFMSGCFVQQGGKCIVTLMVVEKSDPEEPLPLSPTRVRLLLDPDQIAGLDSEEGQSVNLTCTDGGKVLVVDVGERDRLVELQDHALQKAIALSQ